MNDYLLTSKRMKIKKEDAIEESNSIDNWVSDIIEYSIGGFEAFLENIKASKKIKLFANNIEWEIILSLFNIQFHDLIQKFELPKHSDTHRKNLSGFRHVLFESIRTEMYYHIYFWIKRHESSKSIEVFQDQVFDLFLTKMNTFIHPFDFQYSMTSHRAKDDPKVLVSDLMEIQHKVEVGEKFNRGKPNSAYEKVVFEKIIAKFNKLNGTANSESYSDLAKEFAYEEFNYKDEEVEFEGKEVNFFDRFYDRFLNYKNHIRDRKEK